MNHTSYMIGYHEQAEHLEDESSPHYALLEGVLFTRRQDAMAFISKQEDRPAEWPSVNKWFVVPATVEQANWEEVA